MPNATKILCEQNENIQNQYISPTILLTGKTFIKHFVSSNASEQIQ